MCKPFGSEDLINSVHNNFTLSEAVELMKSIDRNPTKVNKPPIKWVDTKTGQLVYIGYT